jgi:hypothetical protein
VVFQQLETDFGVRQRPNDLHKASSWDRGFSFALQLDSATRARTHFKVASADLQLRAEGFHQKMRKDGDGALFLDRALQQIEFVQQF